jgi:hypothetical protein
MWTLILIIVTPFGAASVTEVSNLDFTTCATQKGVITYAIAQDAAQQAAANKIASRVIHAECVLKTK